MEFYLLFCGILFFFFNFDDMLVMSCWIDLWDTLAVGGLAGLFFLFYSFFLSLFIFYYLSNLAFLLT